MRKRSKYKPKGVRLDVVRYVVEGLKPMASHPAVLDLRIKNHGALTAVVKGNATRDDIDVLIAALNMAEALMILRENLGRDWSDEVRAAQDALLNMCQRAVRNGDRFIFTGPEMQAVNLGMEIHDAQIDQASVADLEKAIDLVQQRIMHRQAREIVQKGATT